MTDHPNYKPKDWRWIHHGLDRTNATSAGLSATKCPFEVTLEIEDDVPGYLHNNVDFLKIGEKGAPVQGYYGKLPGRQGVSALVLVTNYWGIWFEVELREGKFVAKRIARPALHLDREPLPGIDITGILASGEELPTASRDPSREPSRAPSRAESFREAIDHGATDHPSDQTTRGRMPPFPPR